MSVLTNMSGPALFCRTDFFRIAFCEPLDFLWILWPDLLSLLLWESALKDLPGKVFQNSYSKDPQRMSADWPRLARPKHDAKGFGRSSLGLVQETEKSPSLSGLGILAFTLKMPSWAPEKVVVPGRKAKSDPHCASVKTAKATKSAKGEC